MGVLGPCAATEEAGVGQGVRRRSGHPGSAPQKEVDVLAAVNLCHSATSWLTAVLCCARNLAAISPALALPSLLPAEAMVAPCNRGARTTAFKSQPKGCARYR